MTTVTVKDERPTVEVTEEGATVEVGANPTGYPTLVGLTIGNPLRATSATTAAFGGDILLDNDGLHLLDTNASHDLIIAPGSDLTADRTLTLTTGDAARTITLSGNPTLADWFDQSVKQAASPTFAGLTLTDTLTITMNLDTVSISHDGTHANFRTNDGHFNFTTDEGSNTVTYVSVHGKGTGYGVVNIYDNNDAEYLELFTDNGVGYLHTAGVSPNILRLQRGGHAGADFFQSADEGETPELIIYGYRTSDSYRSLHIGVGIDAADTASFDGVSNYLFDGDLAVNGGDITSSAATASLFNTTPTTVNIAGGATQITSTTTGVGIGTTSPQKKLHVVGGSAGSGTALLRLGTEGDTAGTESIITFVSDEDGTPSTMAQVVAARTASGGDLKFDTWGKADAMVIDTNGNVGIGTTGPDSKLHIDQASTTAAIPVMTLDQADLSEQFMKFMTTIGVGNPIEAVGAKTLTTTHFIKIEIDGVGDRYIPVGTIA